MSEREPNTTPAPQSGDVSAVELGSAPPSRSESAVLPELIEPSEWFAGLPFLRITVHPTKARLT